MNNILTDMYRSQNDPKPPTTQNEFPIDISSDEDDEDTATKNTNNGTYIYNDFRCIKLCRPTK